MEKTCMNCKHGCKSVCDMPCIMCFKLGGMQLWECDDSNPYWERIEAISARQRAKGMKTYGQGIEANPEALHKRIDMALEELIDLAMYLCWVDDKIKEREVDA